MKIRVAILVVLAFLTLGYRGTLLYNRYFSPDMRALAPFAAQYKDGAMVIEKVRDESLGTLSSGEPKLQVGDIIREIYDDEGVGGPTQSLFAYGGWLKYIGSFDPWVIVVDRPREDGSLQRLTVDLPPGKLIDRDWKEWLTSLSYDASLPLLALAAGLLIGLMKPMDNRAYLAALVFLGYSSSFIQSVAQFPPFFRELGLALRTTAIYFSPYLILQFFLCFPDRSILDRKLPWLRPSLLSLTVLGWIYAMVTEFTIHFSFSRFEYLLGLVSTAGLSPLLLSRIARLVGLGMLFLAVVALVIHIFQARTRAYRRRVVIITVGLVGSMIPALFSWWFAASKTPLPLWMVFLGIPMYALFPLCFVYAVVRHRVFGIRLILRRGLRYALVSKGFLVLEGLLIFGALYFTAVPLVDNLMSGAGSSWSWLGTAAVSLGLLTGVPKVNQKVLPAIDRRFFRDAYNAQQVLTELGHTVRDYASSPPQLLQRVTEQIGMALHPDQVAVFLAPQPWPGLERRVGADAVVWRSSLPGPGVPDRFELYVHETCRLEEQRRRLHEEMGTPVLSSGVSLSVHLNVALRHDPDVLDVFSVDRLIGAGGAPAPGTLAEGDSIRDQDLFERFSARLVVPLVTVGKVIGLMLLGEKLSQEPYTKEDRELLLTVADQAAIALDYSLMIGKVAEQERMKRELQIAREVQSRLLPQDQPVIRGLAYSGMCKTAREVGGDYSDFLHLGSQRLGIALGDIAGKGISAALLMASLQALLRSHSLTLNDDLAELAAELNRHLCENTAESRFATFFIGIYDDETRRLRYVNAGHTPPMLMRKAVGGGSSREVVRLQPGGPVLGMFKDERYTPAELSLDEGDLLLIYSDGLTEAMNSEGECFGEARLEEWTSRHAELSETEISAGLVGQVESFVGEGEAQQDDITLIVAKVV